MDKTSRALQKHGDGRKYQVTLTKAAVKTVHHFKQKSNAITFEEFIVEFPRPMSLLGNCYTNITEKMLWGSFGENIPFGTGLDAIQLVRYREL